MSVNLFMVEVTALSVGSGGIIWMIDDLDEEGKYWHMTDKTAENYGKAQS